MTAPETFSGRCLCGAVSIDATPAGRTVGACHCGMCRRWGGGPMLALDCGTGLHIGGSEHVRSYRSSAWAERAFCSQCGSHLFYRLLATGQHFLAVGILDDQAPWTLEHEIYIDHKPPYYDFANATARLTEAEFLERFGGSSV